jgi:hypothetical protein
MPEKRTDTVGQPQVLVFIGLKRGSRQEYLRREPLTEQRDLALFHASAGRLFSIIYYINGFFVVKNSSTEHFLSRVVHGGSRLWHTPDIDSRRASTNE